MVFKGPRHVWKEGTFAAPAARSEATLTKMFPVEVGLIALEYFVSVNEVCGTQHFP